MKKILLVALFALAPFAADAKNEKLNIDANNSHVSWEGRKITGAHNGHLKVKGGKLEMGNGKLVGGILEIDMTSIVVADLTDPEQNGKLTGHLKSDDFFSVGKHPVSKLVITNVELKNGKHNITGDLTIKGITNKVTFPADVKSEKSKLSASAKMEVDRTKYDIKYRSGKFFPNLGDKVIKDIFYVDVNLVAHP